ncbi:MAG: hypothetical protein H0U76_05645 [Ktedonobacteraceae bacterium]|nr:hypothetical protein [Ktedonobacteraceae bacterium]
MQESEKQYPARKRASERVPDSDYDLDNDERENDRRAPLAPPLLPKNGLQYALGIGIGAGLLTAIIGVLITLLNASTFQDAARLQEKMPLSVAQTIAGLNCLSYFLALLVCFGAGYLAGRVAVRRLFGFYAGALAGAITYLGGIVTQYIPNYPGHIASASTAGAVAGGIFFLITLLLIYAAIGGLMGLWGARTVTRKHPYYLARRHEEDEREESSARG